MRIRLYAPGTRKGNKSYIARFSVKGRPVEITTHQSDEDSATAYAARAFAAIADSRTPEPGEAVTFRKAAAAYIAYRRPNKDDHRRIDRLVKALGERYIADLSAQSFIDTANELYPTLTGASKNRHVIAPARAIMHHAAYNRWCAYIRIKGFKEAAPTTRAMSADAATLLIANANADMRLLLLVLFKQGFRISDALRIDWANNVDLERRVFRVRVAKQDEWREFAMDEEVFFALANVPQRLRGGRLFPWSSRWRVYGPVRALCKKVGVRFTPHMARHSVGAWANARGEGLRTIMELLGHADAKSSLRYQKGDIQVVRAALGRAAKLANKP